MLGSGVVKGMLTTVSHLFQRKVTVQYPDEQMEMPPWTRGRPRLIYDLDSGDLRCTACNACAIACPVDVIKIESHPGPDRKKVLDRFDIDMGGCIECALCVEACPFRAIVMAPDFEMATYDRADALVFNMYQLRIAGTAEVDAAMEHIQGVKRGLARSGGDVARAAGETTGQRADATASDVARGEGTRPGTTAPPAPRPSPPQRKPESETAEETEAQPKRPPTPAKPPAIDPKELEGLSPAEKAALYKQRRQESRSGKPSNDRPKEDA